MRFTLIGLVIALMWNVQRPTFKSDVSVVVVDAHVVDRTGQPIIDLKPHDFEVSISGKARRVTSAEFVSYEQSKTAPRPQPPVTTPAVEGAVAPRPRRMYVLAIDEHSLHMANARAAIVAAERFIDKLQPDDLVSVLAYPTGVAHHDMTTDHAAARAVLRKVSGLFEEPMSRFNLSASEAIDIASDDRDALARVMRRECPAGRCTAGEVRQDAINIATFVEMRVSQSVGALRGVVRALGGIPGRKILVVVSGGLIANDRSHGRAQSGLEISALGREAAQANLALFALHLDWSFFESLNSRSGLRTSYFRDSNLAATGLEMVAGYAGGSVARVHGTSPDPAFDRVLKETSGYYLIGVEAADADRDGEAHPIRVRVKRGGAQVRNRTFVTIPAAKKN